MTMDIKETFFYLCWLAIGLTIGIIFFTPIFDSTLMGVVMGLAIGTSTWLGVRKGAS
ncbi:hypothetical protein JSY36_05840 [Bacillus sp. H-16]|uniref:hypothetical protein n=1 Tax=Alteribacter salitolerans TaxID=2912333 RepID=UPI001963AAE5|nr:hypothetical protein [Alteribacter salitolerans]MBM7095271.1 hypothetical protein [Alteribacter salitolerans]